MGDFEPFIEWLQAQGLTDAAHLAAYREYVAELAKHPSLSAALRAAEEEGKSPRQIANLRQVAARLVEFEAAKSAPGRGAQPAVSSDIEPKALRAASISVAPTASLDVEKPARASSIDIEPQAARTAAGLAVEARQPRPTPAIMQRHEGERRKGCICNKRYDIYLDDDFGALARMFGGGIGIGTIVLIRLVGVLGALTLALGLAGTAGLVTIVSICMRCEGCRRRVTDLDADEQARVRRGRGKVVLVTLALVAGAAICGAAWWHVVKQAHQQQWG